MTREQHLRFWNNLGKLFQGIWKVLLLTVVYPISGTYVIWLVPALMVITIGVVIQNYVSWLKGEETEELFQWKLLKNYDFLMGANFIGIVIYLLATLATVLLDLELATIICLVSCGAGVLFLIFGLFLAEYFDK